MSYVGLLFFLVYVGVSSAQTCFTGAGCGRRQCCVDVVSGHVPGPHRKRRDASEEEEEEEGEEGVVVTTPSVPVTTPSVPVTTPSVPVTTPDVSGPAPGVCVNMGGVAARCHLAAGFHVRVKPPGLVLLCPCSPSNFCAPINQFDEFGQRGVCSFG